LQGQAAKVRLRSSKRSAAQKSVAQISTSLYSHIKPKARYYRCCKGAAVLARTSRLSCVNILHSDPITVSYSNSYSVDSE